MDEAVIPYITSANIACGWYAGNPIVMDKTVKMATKHGVNLGAHQGYPDLYYVSMGGNKVEIMEDIGKELGLEIIYEAFSNKAII